MRRHSVSGNTCTLVSMHGAGPAPWNWPGVHNSLVIGIQCRGHPALKRVLCRGINRERRIGYHTIDIFGAIVAFGMALLRHA